VGEARAKTAEFPVFCAQPIQEKFSCKLMVPMESVYPEGVLFESPPTRYQQPKMEEPQT